MMTMSKSRAEEIIAESRIASWPAGNGRGQTPLSTSLVGQRSRNCREAAIDERNLTRDGARQIRKVERRDVADVFDCHVAAQWSDLLETAQELREVADPGCSKRF